MTEPARRDVIASSGHRVDANGLGAGFNESLGSVRVRDRIRPAAVPAAREWFGDVLIASDLSREPRGGPQSRCRRTASA